MYPTWSNILASHFNDSEYFNYGHCGAGNYFIFNKVLEADLHFNFNKDDLVIVEWTNIRRDDFFDSRDMSWKTPGNIYTQSLLPVTKFHNDIHFALRDYAFIHSIYQQFHSKTNLQFLQMLDLFKFVDQWTMSDRTDLLSDVVSRYEYLQDKFPISFYEYLWDNDIDKKAESVKEEINSDYSDYHPSIKEHMQYVKHIFKIENTELEKTAINAHDMHIKLAKNNESYEPLNSFFKYDSLTSPELLNSR